MSLDVIGAVLPGIDTALFANLRWRVENNQLITILADGTELDPMTIPKPKDGVGVERAYILKTEDEEGIEHYILHIVYTDGRDEGVGEVGGSGGGGTSGEVARDESEVTEDTKLIVSQIESVPTIPHASKAQFGTVRISPDNDNAIEITENGIKVNKSESEGVSISKKEGNTLTEEPDGLFVPPSNVAVSKEKGNALEERGDGLFVPKTSEVKISEEADNAIEEKEDGLFVKETKISEEADNAIEEKEDGLYVAASKEVEINLSVKRKLGKYLDKTIYAQMVSTTAESVYNVLDYISNNIPFPENVTEDNLIDIRFMCRGNAGFVWDPDDITKSVNLDTVITIPQGTMVEITWFE